MPVATSIAAFQPLPWVNEYTRTAAPIDDASFGPILHFSLMWNLFERDACGREATPQTIEKSVEKAFTDGRLSLTAFGEHVVYFRDRSQRPGMTAQKYLDNLRLTNPKARKLVDGLLSGSLSDTNNLVHALLLIAHRIRNNLFHGEKEVALLHTQVDLFRTVNSLLATYLAQTRDDAA